MNVKKYYDLKDSSKKEEYEKVLYKLSKSTNSRDLFLIDGKVEERRKELHDNIIEKSIGQYPFQKKPIIHFMLGSIGSGKTSAKDKIIKQEDKKNFLYINFDDIKLKLPEYKILKKLNPKKAAQFVQSESSKIAGRLFKSAIKKPVHIIYEKNLRTKKDGSLHIVEEIKRALKKKYSVHINIIFLDSYKEAWKRVQKRYEEIKRYVPKKEVEESFDSLFPNLNTILKTSCIDDCMVKFWYNSMLSIPEIENDKKTYLIGGIVSNTIPKNTLNELIVYNSKNDVLHLFLFQEIVKVLPKLALRQIKKLDLFLGLK